MGRAPGRGQPGALSATVQPGPDRALRALRLAERAGTLPPVLAFWGHTPRSAGPGPWLLSQWWRSEFRVDGVRYRSAEMFMMAEKAALMGDLARRARILATDDPRGCKALGRAVTPYDGQLWERERYAVVLRGSAAKFGQDPALRSYLAGTAPAVLVEASPDDRVWGVGLDADDPAVGSPSAWRGGNLLGLALMQVRATLRP